MRGDRREMQSGMVVKFRNSIPNLLLLFFCRYHIFSSLYFSRDSQSQCEYFPLPRSPGINTLLVTMLTSYLRKDDIDEWSEKSFLSNEFRLQPHRVIMNKLRALEIFYRRRKIALIRSRASTLSIMRRRGELFVVVGMEGSNNEE